MLQLLFGHELLNEIDARLVADALNLLEVWQTQSALQKAHTADQVADHKTILRHVIVCLRGITGVGGRTGDQPDLLRRGRHIIEQIEKKFVGFLCRTKLQQCLRIMDHQRHVSGKQLNRAFEGGVGFGHAFQGQLRLCKANVIGDDLVIATNQVFKYLVGFIVAARAEIGDGATVSGGVGLLLVLPDFKQGDGIFGC